mgnify:CR=1 FL=1
MGTAFKVLTLKIAVPVMAGDPLISITGHYTAYPSGGVKQYDEDIDLFVERDAPALRDGTHPLRKIIDRLIASRLDKDL